MGIFFCRAMKLNKKAAINCFRIFFFFFLFDHPTDINVVNVN